MPIKDFFKILKKPVNAAPEKPVMKVTMMGARGVGKTSVLTSMYYNMNTAMNKTNLYIRANEGTQQILSDKVQNLQDMFLDDNTMSDSVQSGIAGDKNVTTFEFDFGLTLKNINIGIELKDFPGEYVLSEPETVKEYIDESNAIILAIDTPHLMENDGKYNEAKNRTKVITEFFKEALNSESGEKLVMFVPLKCEKYLIENRMDEVGEKVKSTYIELLKFLRDRDNLYGIEGKIACVLAPIFTLGEIKFDRFELDENGNIAEAHIGELCLPKKATYAYTKPGASYKPKYCEQPLYYLLTFVSKQYDKLKKADENIGWIAKFKRMFRVTPETNDLFVEVQKFSFEKNQNQDGYKIFFGHGKV